MSVLGIDLGTGSVKLMLAGGGQKVSSASEAYPVDAPFPGFAETGVEQWLGAIARCTERLGVLSGLEAVGLSGQMHGVVPVSLTRGALHPAILWADQRGKEVFPLLEALPGEFRERLRNSWTAGMALTTILWLKEHRRELYDAADVFLLPKDYLRWALTGVVGTEHSDASGTLMYDMETGRWMLDLLSQLGLDPGKLPPIFESGQFVGKINEKGSLASGLPVGVGVCAGAGDTPSAIFGAGLPVEDTIQISIGTGTQVVRLRNSLPRFHPALSLFVTVRKGVYYQMAGMLNGGLALEWVRSTVGLTWEEFYAEAETCPAPWDLQFLPYLSGERTPYLNPDARGVWSGLALHHKPIQLLYSALLGVACSVRLGVETIGTAGCHQYRVVGGSSQYSFWNQLLADILTVPLEVSSLKDASSWGAVRLASEAAGRDLQVPVLYQRYEPSSLPPESYYREFLDLYRRLQLRRENP